jgi:aminopeptidase N
VFLARHDDDPFARYEAMQDLMVGHLVAASKGELGDEGRAAGKADIVSALRSVIKDEALDDLMRGELLSMPSQTYIMEQIEAADPGRIFEEREALKAAIGADLKDELHRLYERVEAVPYSQSAEAKGARKLKTLILVYASASDPQKAAELAAYQYDNADNMTDRQGALMVLTGIDSAERTGRLIDFYNRYQGNALVIDKWFSLQAMSLHPKVVEHVKALADHVDFTLKNPNRVRSLYMAFAANPHGFHAASGEGYRMIADLILELDPINAQTAARFVPALGRWRKVEPGRSALMREQLERIAAAPKLSRDTFEQVTRSLG